jgi:hypothetical protein
MIWVGARQQNRQEVFERTRKTFSASRASRVVANSQQRVLSLRSEPDGRQGHPAESFAQEALDAGVSKLVVAAQLSQHRADLALSKAEVG